MVPLFPGRIGNEVLVFGEEKNRMTRIGNLGERTRTNDKLNPNMTPSLRIEPRPQGWEVNTPITMECKLLT